MTKAYFYDDTAVEISIDAETLWVMYQACHSGLLECRVRILVGRRRLWLDLKFLNREKTFTEAILAAHADTSPPPGEMAVTDGDAGALQAPMTSIPPPSGERSSR